MKEFKPPLNVKSHVLISEFINSEIPIAKVDWKKRGYRSVKSCFTTLWKSKNCWLFPVEVTMFNKEVYLLNPEFIKTI